MNLPRIGVKYPVTTAMFFIALILIGLVSYGQLGVDLMPELEVPVISVRTHYPGASPEEVESDITEVLERSLATVSDLDEMESVSTENNSSITLRFGWGVNLDEATNDVRDKLDLARRDLPDDADDPTIFKFDLSMIPIYIMGITADQSLPDLYDIAEDDISRQLETVPGVASAMLRGGDRRQVNIKLNLSEMNAYGIPVGVVRDAVRNANLTLPVGRLETGGSDYLLRVPGRVRLEEISNIIVKRDGERKVYLKDIAEVDFGYEEATRMVRINGRDGMMMMIQKRSGENTVEVARRVRDELDNIRGRLPSDVEIHIIRDFSEFIEATVDTLQNSLLLGALFVALIMLFFLGDVASSLKIITALPTSLIIAFFLLHLGGYTLNVISLSSLAIALGMVVDGAVVVLDNIARKKETGMALTEGVIEGAEEVAKPVVASALTTIVVFFPVFYVGGVAGIFFQQMAFVIILTLGISLLSALWLIPMLSSKTRNDLTPRFIKTKFIAKGQALLVFLEDVYEKALRRVLNRPWTFLGAMGACFLLSLLLFGAIEIRFMSEADADFFTLVAELPLGTRKEVTEEVVRDLEEMIEREVPEKITMVKRWGYGRGGGGPGARQEGSHVAWGAVRLVSRLDRDRSVFEIVDSLRPEAAKIPGARIRFSTEDPLAGMLFGAGKPLVLELYGRDLDQVTDYAHDLESMLEGQPGIYDLEVSRELGRPELNFAVDRNKADRLGLSVAEIAYTLRTLFEGEDISEFSHRGKNYDINLRLRKEDRAMLDDIERVFFPLQGGGAAKISEVTRMGFEAGPSVVERKNQQRMLKLSANIRDIDIDHAVELVRKAIDDLGLPEGITYAFGGEYQEKEEAFGLLLIATVLAILLVYMVMASQFESLVHPFFVLFSIPFAFVGVAVLLLVTNTQFTMDSFLGIIMLVGIVVNNAIVLISYMNLQKAKGPGDLLEVVVRSGQRRLRPILLTTFSTISALLPLSLQRGQGSEYWRPFSNPIIGGLSLAFVVTLFIIPTLYYLYERRKALKEGTL